VKKIFVVILTAGLLFEQGRVCWATDDDAFQFFQEEAKVVTASRREQSIKDIPAAVDVITAEDIRVSGATTLWDLLRFRVGMDVLDARANDGTRGSVAVRGFPQEYVHNLQVLLDGRSIYEPISTGVFWDKLPISTEDIERIEIIRGPNATLYGSGAGLGVINIITQKALKGPATATIKSFGGNRKTVESSESLESSVKNISYRVSHTFDQQAGFPLASGGDNGTDFLHSNKANTRITWTPSKQTDLELFAGGSWQDNGVAGATHTEAKYNDHFEMVKLSQKIGMYSTVELLSSRNNYITDVMPAYPSGTGQYSVLQYDEEILQRWQWDQNKLNATYGFNYRHADVNSPLIFAGSPDQKMELWSAYLNQSFQVSHTVSITGGVSFEDSNVGSADSQQNYQVASLWSPLEHHSFYVSYAVAHTVPSLFGTSANNQFNQVLRSVGNPDLKPQRLTSYEIGHRGDAMDKHLQMNTSLYYTTIKNIDATIVQSAVFFPQPSITLVTANLDEAITRGVETELKYLFSLTRSVYMNYTYEHVSDWLQDRGSITQNTPAHKINFGAVSDLGHGFTGSVNVGYKDHYYITSVGRSVSVAAPAYWRLDLRLAYAVTSRLELFIAGQNLTANEHIEFADGLTVPRTYQGGLSVKFGSH